MNGQNQIYAAIEWIVVWNGLKQLRRSATNGTTNEMIEKC